MTVFPELRIIRRSGRRIIAKREVNVKDITILGEERNGLRAPWEKECRAADLSRADDGVDIA